MISITREPIGYIPFCGLCVPYKSNHYRIWYVWLFILDAVRLFRKAAKAMPMACCTYCKKFNQWRNSGMNEPFQCKIDHCENMQTGAYCVLPEIRAWIDLFPRSLGRCWQYWVVERHMPINAGANNEK